MDGEVEEIDDQPVGRRRVKQVLYSDKSESSVDDMMADTPSNYNIANGRLEGKSMGLKAILLFAKNQGMNIGGQAPGNSQLPQIQEEGPVESQRRNHPLGSSGEGTQWNVSQPLNGKRTQIVGYEEMDAIAAQNRTLDADGHRKNTKSKRGPGVTKQFKEPGDLTERHEAASDLARIRKNNYV